MTRLTCLAVVVLAFGRPTLPERDGSNDFDLLQGTWGVTGTTSEGKAAGDNQKGVKAVFAGNKMVFKRPERPGENVEWFSHIPSIINLTFKLDQTKNPKAIDLTFLDGPNKGEVARGIYQLDGVSLQLCVPNEAAKPRPTEFSAPVGSRLILFTLRKS